MKHHCETPDCNAELYSRREKELGFCAPCRAKRDELARQEAKKQMAERKEKKHGSFLLHMGVLAHLASMANVKK